MHINQRASAIRTAVVLEFVRLSSCNHVTGRSVVFVRLALEVVFQKDGDFVGVILLYINSPPAAADSMYPKFSFGIWLYALAVFSKYGKGRMASATRFHTGTLY